MEKIKRPIYKIALEIQADWEKIPVSASVYLEPMLRLWSVDDRYGYDSGRAVVMYFLSNAGTWRGENARRLKTELKEIVK